jgi:transcriptional regulator with XRE-family HTH domain
MYFSNNVSHLLELQRVKKSMLAEAIGVAPSQVSKYASGKGLPKVELIIEIAKYFNVNIDDLLLKDLSQEAGRPFGAEGEDVASTDATLTRMNELLEQRVKVVEMALKRENPDLARELGIE